jgi:CO/xanthine dehydrogenase Mo-binding subunit
VTGRVGDSPRRVGGQARVTGDQRYVADILLPDLLHAKLVTVDCARAGSSRSTRPRPSGCPAFTW